jgi:uncharacterized protein YdcH (DUF465 family)
MSHTPDSLHEAFPELGERISALKIADPRFSELADRYDRLNHEIRHIEHGLEPADDAVVEDLKKQRLAVKDALHTALTRD